jgi:hypothetical protein
MRDRTYEVILRQTQAMGTKLFEVGLFKPTARAEMLLRTWDSDTLIQSIAWLKFENLDGRNIYIRPKGEHALSMVDDLTADALERMRHSGFTPALIVETSPDNFQAWLNHGRTLPKDISTAAARSLAQEFGGDRGAADWRHFGRLSGFTNRKEKYRQPSGLYPFVRLVHTTGEVYEKAKEFLAEVEARMEAARIESERRRLQSLSNRGHDRSGAVRTIDTFRHDGRYAGDGNRVDLAYAIYAISRGVSEDDVRAAIASRDLTHKGTEKRQAEYIDRTIQKALENTLREGRAR